MVFVIFSFLGKELVSMLVELKKTQQQKYSVRGLSMQVFLVSVYT